jgi:transcriptional regulator with XRE-family HTH domain
MAGLKFKRTPKGERKYFVALLVGSDSRFQGAVRDNLALSGVYVKYRWAATGGAPLDRREIPSDVDVVIVLRDSNLSRHVRDRIYNNARGVAWAIDVPAVHSQIATELERQGFVKPPINVDDIENPSPVPEPEAPKLALVPSTPVENEPVEEDVAVTDTLAGKKRRMEDAGRRVREAREAKGISTAAMAKSVGVSGSYIGAIEKGVTTPSDAVCGAVERFLGMPAETLPRLSTRKNNNRLAQQLAVVVPKIVDPPPPPPPPEPPPVSTVAQAIGEDEAYDRILLQLAKIQRQFAGLGITKIEVTAKHVSVERS